MWVPVPSDAVRHLTVQSGIPVPLPDHAVGSLAQRLEVPAAGVFHFSATRKAIGNTTVTLATQSAFRYSGGADSTASALHVGFVLNGSMTIGLGLHPPQRFSPISAYVMPAGVASSVQATEVTRGLGIQLPQARLTARGIQLEGERLRLERSASLAAPLRVLALAVVEAAWTPTAIGASVTERTIEDLVVGMFLEGEGYAMDSVDLRAGLRLRAVAHIAARHRNRDLSPSVVAAQLGVSLRHLQRAFEGGGSTVAAEISRCRAESAAQLLLAPRTAGLTIADIATRSGYTSAFELRAGFRARYGVLPSQFRIGDIPLPATRRSGRA
jgi:AraC-like DNA-binding protein